MKTLPWTARFTDKATAAACVATRFVRDRRHLRHLVWALVGLVALQATTEVWQALVAGSAVTLTLLVHLLILGCCGGVIFLSGRVAARAQQLEQRHLALRTLELASVRGGEEEARGQQLRFSALMAHQFRNPLAIIKSQAQVTEREASTHPEDAHASQVLRRQRIIEGAVTRLEGLFQQWQDHDPWAAEPLAPKPEPLPVGPWLARTTQAFGPRTRRPVTLDLPAGINDLRLHADEGLLTRALGNLLDNAAKYSPPGSAIGLKALRFQGELGIQVRDTGIGIAAADLERIFLKAVRLAPEGEVAGMGLGLHLARRIAVLHGGRIDVASLPGQGSTFTLWLPLDP